MGFGAEKKNRPWHFLLFALGWGGLNRPLVGWSEGWFINGVGCGQKL